MHRMKWHRWILLLILTLAACAGQGAPVLPVTDIPPGQSGGGQPLTPWMSERMGFRLQTPLGFEIRPGTETEIAILAPAETLGHRERAFISVESAAGRSIDQLAEEMLANFEGFEIERQELTLAGQAAVLLDQLPGQDLSRQLLVVHDGRLYRLTFIPSDPNQAEAYQQMETLYSSTLDSFEFLPVVSEPEPDHEAFQSALTRALEDGAEATLIDLMGPSFTFGFWRGEGYQVTAADALAQLQENYLPADGGLAFNPTADLAALLEGMDPYALLGPDVDPVLALHSMGWGADRAGEAILYVARDAAGDLYWHAILLAPEGF